MCNWYNQPMTKVAVITGSSYGLGKSICEKLLKMGYKVYGISRSKSIFRYPNFTWIQADLYKSPDITRIPENISEKEIDILVNNAGTAFEKTALQYKDEDFDKAFNINFKAPIKVTKVLIKRLINGFIINISSISDRYPDPLFGLYASSKAALNIYFETMAAENKDLTVVNLLPNYIDTPMQHKVRDIHKEFDWKKTMKPDDVAEVIPFLIKSKNRIESGSRIIIISKTMGDYSKNPEKLWIYNVDDKSIEKVK